MELKTLQYNLNYINECYLNITKNRDIINNLKETIKSDENVISNIIKQAEIESFINNKLQESIDKFDLNNGRDENEFNISKCTSCSSDGNYEEHEMKEKNLNSKFNPYKDNWEFSSIEYKDNAYKITVENIKGRKFLNPFMWEPDYFSTDWIKIIDE